MQITGASGNIDDCESNTAPLSSGLSGNQQNIPSPTVPTPGPEDDSPHEEESGELCLRSMVDREAPGIGCLSNVLSLVPANYNSMRLAQQQAIHSAANRVEGFLHRTLEKANRLSAQSTSGRRNAIQRTNAEMEIFSDLLRSSRVLKHWRVFTGRGSQEFDLADSPLGGFFQEAFHGLEVNLSQFHQELHPLRTLLNLLRRHLKGNQGVWDAVIGVTLIRHGKVESLITRSQAHLKYSRGEIEFSFKRHEYDLDHEALREEEHAGQTTSLVIEELD